MSAANALSTIRFTDWDLAPEIAEAISAKGWEYATPIQAESVPMARSGKDIVGQARTGSGKTVAFGIPIIENCQATGQTELSRHPLYDSHAMDLVSPSRRKYVR